MTIFNISHLLGRIFLGVVTIRQSIALLNTDNTILLIIIILMTIIGAAIIFGIKPRAASLIAIVLSLAIISFLIKDDQRIMFLYILLIPSYLLLIGSKHIPYCIYARDEKNLQEKYGKA